ncbi:PD-(D/E)XK nuclease family protein [Helicobacter pylori]|uniref:PD-(D/E)XK nuclease family protein n=1 Tax=Helicobacter pylori TaxID=210 RepID=UPI002F35DA2E
MSDYQPFFYKVKHALKELEIKRARGLHDYNVFSVLMSESDEVRHSSFLHSFLDPMGGHYQKDLFLKVFLKVCDLESFGFNSADTKIVKKEVTTNGSRRMDLFLSDKISVTPFRSGELEVVYYSYEEVSNILDTIKLPKICLDVLVYSVLCNLLEIPNNETNFSVLANYKQLLKLAKDNLTNYLSLMYSKNIHFSKVVRV